MSNANDQLNKISTANLDEAFDQHSLEDWQAIAEKSLRGESLESLAKCSAGGLATQALYTDRPITGSALPSLPLQRWDNRLNLLHDSAQQQNKILLEALQGGISSVQLNMDSRQEHYATRLDEIETVFQNVQLDIVPISLKSGAAFSEAASHLETIWRTHGVSENDAQGAINADPIGTLAAIGNASDIAASDNLEAQLNAMSELALNWQSRFPKVSTVCVDASCYHNAGASIEQELIASIATAAIYMQSMLNNGMDATSAHDSLIFQIACDADTIANVVKLRSLKKLWHHVVNHMGVKRPTTRLVTETSRRMQSRQAPWVNHLRNVSAAAASAMVGAQSIVVHPHNYIDGEYIDDDKHISSRVARNIAIILSEESNMTFVNDPMFGSYAIETLTSELCDKTWHGLQTLEKNGGLIEQLKNGQWQSQIAEHQRQRVARLHDNVDIQIGVNKFQSNTSTKTPAPTKSGRESNSSAAALHTRRDAVDFEVNA